MNATQTPSKRFELVDYTRLVPSKFRGGKDYQKQVWADGGAVDQGGNLAVKQCNCGSLVAWAKSSRTGKSYLCHVYRYSSNPGRHYYVKASVHTHEVHERNIAQREEERARLEAMTPAGRIASLEECYTQTIEVLSADPFSAKNATELVRWVWLSTGSLS